MERARKNLTKAGAMGDKFRIVIAEDYTIVRQGLKSLLDSFSDFTVVGEAVDGKEAIESVGRLRPDLVLMDLSMPKTGGVTAIKEIKKRLPETKILALTVHKTVGHVRMALEAGADGYILKDASCTELEMAIRNLLDGKSYLSPEISDGIIQGYLSGVKTAKTVQRDTRARKLPIICQSASIPSINTVRI